MKEGNQAGWRSGDCKKGKSITLMAGKDIDRIPYDPYMVLEKNNIGGKSKKKGYIDKKTNKSH